MKARSRGLHHFVVCFGPSGRRNKVVFEDEDLLLSWLKILFVYFMCSWVSLVLCSDSLIIRKLVPLVGS